MAAALALAAPAQAFKPRTSLYLANEAASSLLVGTANSVSIGGREYPVAEAVANSIRNHKQHFRGGVVGAYGFPDLPAGWGNVQRDTRTDNGTRPDRGPGDGRSFSREWLEHVHRAGWAAYEGCNGCTRGQQALAFSYGYLIQAATAVWGHTVTNEAAGGPVPVLAQSNLVLRHLIVEEYIARHTPSTALAIDAPTGFLYDTFIDDPAAAEMGRGSFIDPLARFSERLKARRERFREQVRDLTDSCLVSVGGRCRQRGTRPEDVPRVALLRLQIAVIPPWRDLIEATLRNYPGFSRELARALFTRDIRQFLDNAVTMVQRLVVEKGLGSLVDGSKVLELIAGALGSQAASVVVRLERFVVNSIADSLTAVIREANTRQLLASFLASPMGPNALVEAIPVLADPSLYVNRANIGFASDTSAKLDRVMGLTRDGVQNPGDPFALERFAAARNAVTLSRLALLDAEGLNRVLADHGVAPRYEPGDHVMLGWTRALAGDHQWRERSTRDGRRYGEGTLPLWEDCAARTRVFRALFSDWEHGTENFPDLGAHPAGCHGWTTANRAPSRYEVAFGAAPDGADAVTFRLRLRGLDLGTLPVTGRVAGSAGSARGRSSRAPGRLGAVPVVLARRHLETPAETVSFTYETGGQGGLGLDVYGDGRRLRSLRAPGPVVLTGVNAREIVFRLAGSGLPGAVVGGPAASGAWFARVSHLRTTAAGWEASLAARTTGVDAGRLEQVAATTGTGSPGAATAAAAFAADPGAALRGSATALRRSADPVDTLTFRFEPGHDQSRLALAVTADGREVRTLTGPAQDVTLTGLNAREIGFRWSALTAPALAAPMAARVTGVRTTTAAGTPPPPAPAPAPPAPPPVSRSGVDVRAPAIRGLTVRIVRRRARRTLVVGFRLSERARVLVRLLRGRRLRALRRTGALRAGRRHVLRIPVRRGVPAGVHVADLVARDAAGNFSAARRRAAVPRIRP